jgi:hypothetical protein
MKRRIVWLVAAMSLVLGTFAAPASAGKLGHKVADSGPRFGGNALTTAKIRGHKKVFFKATSNPAQPFTGYGLVNCLTHRLRTVFHRDNGLPVIQSGYLIRRINLPRRKHYDYCVVNPQIFFSTPNGSGELRVQVFVRPR